MTAGDAPAEAGAGLHCTWLRRHGQGDPVVMIHGFGGDHNAWRMLVAAAALPRPVLAIDLPGHGRSPAGASTFAAIVQQAADAIVRQGVTDAHVVGHSLGAAVSVGVAEAGRFATRSLFLLAPAGLGSEIDGKFLTGFCQARSQAELAPWMSMLVVDPANIPAVFVEVTAETRARLGVADAQQRLAQNLFPGGKQAFSIHAALADMAVPRQIVVGSADRIIPPAHSQDLPAPIARHVLPGIGHMPQIEAVDAVARLLVAHVDEAA